MGVITTTLTSNDPLTSAVVGHTICMRSRVICSFINLVLHSRIRLSKSIITDER